jgi:acyl-CoA thioester hydrolase
MKLSALHTIPILVGPEDIDDLGHVNNVAYLRWVQQVAEAHWAVLAQSLPADQVRAIMWVVRRHEVDYLKQAFAGERVEATTWVSSCTRTTCDRATEIRRAAGRELVARALSTYCVLDAGSGRLLRVSAELRAVFGDPELLDRPAEPAFPHRPTGC